ncbi:MAG: hypothetical protein IJP46_07995, partial [Prevotella sp.]|nr:hypothetical protein [Prevotella sp.]
SPTKTSCFGLEKRRFQVRKTLTSDSKTSCFGVSSRLFLSFKSIQPHTHLAVFSRASSIIVPKEVTPNPIVSDALC